ncbi:hypothetical protein EN839_34510, partial [Mesorhizobium sp. M1C.F.Ca.ET.196.01.1.1]|uniref:hypothetical protein n=1 Tax=Mesorhizobium sp. M1C.F.Ca.ET.196.01.1.1 TaxID=2563928 RepID=UPI0010920844
MTDAAVKIVTPDRFTRGSKLVDALGNQAPDPVLFSQAANTPPLLLARGVGADPQAHQLALLAITRMARFSSDVSIRFCRLHCRLSAQGAQHL